LFSPLHCIFSVFQWQAEAYGCCYRAGSQIKILGHLHFTIFPWKQDRRYKCGFFSAVTFISWSCCFRVNFYVCERLTEDPGKMFAVIPLCRVKTFAEGGEQTRFASCLQLRMAGRSKIFGRITLSIDSLKCQSNQKNKNSVRRGKSCLRSVTYSIFRSPINLFWIDNSWNNASESIVQMHACYVKHYNVPNLIPSIVFTLSKKGNLIKNIKIIQHIKYNLASTRTFVAHLRDRLVSRSHCNKKKERKGTKIKPGKEREDTV